MAPASRSRALTHGSPFSAAFLYAAHSQEQRRDAHTAEFRDVHEKNRAQTLAGMHADVPATT